MKAPPPSWAAFVLALTATAFLLLFFVVPHAITADGHVRFSKLDALLRHGVISGERFSMIGPVFAAPFWLFAESASLLWWCARYNVLVLLAGVAIAWWSLRPALPDDERATFLLLLAATGMLPNAVRDFYGELFSAVLVGSGLLIVAAKGRWAGWIPVVLGVANMPGSAVGLALVAAARIWKSRRFDGVLALAAAAALFCLENVLTRGTPFDAGYQGDHGYVTVMPFSGKPGFSYPMLLGVLSLLFSFGKGLLFFAPALLLIAGARRQRPALADFFDVSLAFLAGVLLVYSRWWAWYGGWTWGPRFLLFAAYPSALALAISIYAPSRMARRIATVALTGWTVWVGVSGAVFDLNGLNACIENRYALEHLCWFVPEYSPLLRPFVMRSPAFVWRQEVWMAFAAVVAGVLMTSGSKGSRVPEKG